MNNIIGYKAPFDLYVGTDYCIKKGTVLTKHPTFDFIYTSRPVNEIGSGFGIAKEIVETWEGVYEELTETKELFNKIIGYKLLKDLPQISKGKIGKFFNGEGSIAFCFDDSDKFFDFVISFVQNNKDWFEPVYEKSQKEIVMNLVESIQKDKQNKVNINDTVDSILKLFEIKIKEW